MRKCTPVYCCLLMLIMFWTPGAQAQVSGIRNANPSVLRNSPMVMAYRVNASMLEYCLEKDTLDLELLRNQKPVQVFASDSVDPQKLPKGNYMLLRVEDNKVRYTLVQVNHLQIFPVSNTPRLQIFVRNRDTGDVYIRDAAVWINRKRAKFIPETGGYEAGRHLPEISLVKVCAQGDTSFTRVVKQDDGYHYPKHYRHHTTQGTKGSGTRGTMIFNQPKYKPADTVRWKAYILNHKDKLYRMPLDVYLSYYDHYLQVYQKLGSIQADQSNGYTSQFPLSDSLASDKAYAIHSRLLQDGEEVSSLKAGKDADLEVSVHVDKDAEYVMVEIPIPAGCTYASKEQDWYGERHTEFLKNKVVMFEGSLSAGEHTYHIPLQVRYGGRYTLNPAKVSLMYYPFYFGRNDMKKISIKE